MIRLNKIILAGELVHKDRPYIYSTRLSGYVDKIPLNDDDNYFAEHQEGDICVKGHIITENKDGHLIIEVQADRQCTYYTDMDTFRGIGHICKKPVLRQTPISNKHIVDVVLAFNIGKETAFIPCIVWGYNALEVALMEVGESLYVTGRLQSRNYKKHDVEHTAYELSISTIERIERGLNK